MLFSGECLWGVVCSPWSCREMHSLQCILGQTLGLLPGTVTFWPGKPPKGDLTGAQANTATPVFFNQELVLAHSFCACVFSSSSSSPLLLMVLSWCILFKMSFFIYLPLSGPEAVRRRMKFSSSLSELHMSRAPKHTRAHLGTREDTCSHSHYTLSRSHTCIKKTQVFCLPLPQSPHFSLSLFLSVSPSLTHTPLQFISPEASCLSPSQTVC